MERAKDYSTLREEINERLNIPRDTIVEFRTEQDLRIAELWKADPNFENTSLDFLLEEEMDKFTNELRICTFRSRYFGFPYKHPIDLLYISKPQGEQLYILYTSKDFMDDNGGIIFNINGKTNIELKKDYEDSILNGKTDERFEPYYYRWDDGHIYSYKKAEIVSFLPISKENFLKCCHAEHLSVRIQKQDSSIDYESDCDDLIPFFQMLYNRVCDNNMFVENKAIWREQIQDCYEKSVCPLMQSAITTENKRKEWNKEFNKQVEKENKKFAIAIIGGIIGIIGLIVLLVSNLLN